MKCTSCGAVYDTDVHPNAITLIRDGRVEIFPTFDTSETPAEKGWRFWKR